MLLPQPIQNPFVLTAMLTQKGFESVVASNGVEAWNILRQPGAPEMAIVDWVMPEMDGIELVRRIRAKQTEQPPYIIMLTAMDNKADIITGLDAGANDYISKPFDMGELRARVEVGRRLLQLQSELIKSREEMAYLAMHDQLTGMMNRAAIIEHLSGELARVGRDKGSLAIGMLDIDHFKQVNDTYGHPAGDETLRRLAEILMTNQRKYDAVGRLGGEEFLMITPVESGVNPIPLFERLRARLADAEITTSAGVVSVTVSVGVVRAFSEMSIREILRHADKALYQAKDQGRNCVVCLDNFE